MRFRLEHHFEAPVAVVEATMADPDYLASVVLPDVGRAELIERVESPGRLLMRTRHHYTGELDSLARRVLGSTDVGWDQEVTIDTAGHQAQLRIIPLVAAGQFSCSGTYRFLDHEGATIRTLEGELRLKVPLIGAMAERRVGDGMVRRMEIEARQLAEWLGRSGR